MIITVTSFNGGVGKSTTAIHLAAYLATKRNKTVLADGDLNRSVINWYERGGEGLAFSVCDGESVPDEHDHLVVDTAARPTDDELVALAETSDLLVILCTPTTFSLEATIGTLAILPSDRYKILLTVVPPRPSREGDKALSALKKAGLPVFNTMIRRFSAYLKATWIKSLPQLRISKVGKNNQHPSKFKTVHCPWLRSRLVSRILVHLTQSMLNLWQNRSPFWD